MKIIKTALLSYGMSGKVFHAPFLELHEGYQIVGAWERSKKLIQQDYPSAKSYDSLEELLADDIDLVIVNTPVATHYEYAKKVLQSGRHALVEKAFTTTTAEAEELAALAQENKVKLCVFQNRRWDSDVKTVKRIIEQGVLGEIVEAEIRFDRYNPNLSAKPHKESKNEGAGVLKDLGPHIIDQAVHLFGFPDAVFADLRVIREHSLVDDGLDILLYYPQMRVRLRAGFFFREAVPAYAIHGKLGSFLKHRGDVQEDVLKTGAKPSPESWGAELPGNEGLLHTEKEGSIIREQVPTLNGNYYDLFDGLYHAITADKRVPVPAEDGIKVMKIIDAAIKSSELKKVIILQ